MYTKSGNAGHTDGAPGLFGVEITTTSDGYVAARFRVNETHLADDGAIDAAIILCIASRVARHGASLQLKTRRSSTTLDCKTSFLMPCHAEILLLEAKLVHVNEEIQVWRIIVRDDQRRSVAEITQMETVGTDRQVVPAFGD